MLLLILADTTPSVVVIAVCALIYLSTYSSLLLSYILIASYCMSIAVMMYVERGGGVSSTASAYHLLLCTMCSTHGVEERMHAVLFPSSSSYYQ